MSPRQSVVHVVWGAGFGGIERLVADLARVQAESGVNVQVLVCSDPSGDATVGRYAAPGVEVVTAGLRSGWDLRPWQLKSMSRTMSQSNVVHVHGYTPAVSVAIHTARRPALFTEHGLFSLAERWPSRPAVKQTLKRFFLRNDIATVAAVSRWVAETMRTKYHLAEDKIALVPDGARFERITSRLGRTAVLEAEEIDPSDFVMVVAARLAAVKRIDRLLSALAQQHPRGRSWTLVIAGTGPIENELRTQASRLGIDDRVRFLGYRDDVWELVGAADLVPVPSELESFGLVVVEAMALERPVVAFDSSGGPAEIIQEVGGGCLVDSVESLARVIECGRFDEPLPGFRPLDYVRLRRTYSIEATAAAYADLYSAAVGTAERRLRRAR